MAAGDSLIKLGAPAQTEAAMFVSIVYGAMLSARAFGNAGLFKEVTDYAVAKLVKPRKAPRTA